MSEGAHKKSYRDDVSRIRWFTQYLRGKTLDQISWDSIDQLIERRLCRGSDRTKDLYVALSANTRTWRKALKASGIKGFRWHDLRHTWATWLRQADVPTWVLQELGG